MSKSEQAFNEATQDKLLHLFISDVIRDFHSQPLRVMLIAGDSGYGKSLLASKILEFDLANILRIDRFSKTINDQWICDIDKLIDSIQDRHVVIEGTCSNYDELVSRLMIYKVIMPFPDFGTYRAIMANKAIDGKKYDNPPEWVAEWTRKSKLSNSQVLENFIKLYQAYTFKWQADVMVLNMPWYGPVTRGWH